MKKRLLIVLGLIMLAGTLVACGKKEQASAEPEVTELEDIEPVVTEPEATEEEDETSNVDDLGSSFGLKDFEGFYFHTYTENMDGYDVTYTYGYQFNGDGTGTFYAQDTVDITWNETEIHFDGYAYNYDMEPGKLTVHADDFDYEFEKAEGKVIKPNPYSVDVNNVPDGIYPASFISDDISDTDGKYKVSATIFTEDTYDIVDIGTMAEGDVLVVDGRLYVVNSINKLNSGLMDINGGIEEGGTSLISMEDSNCYVYSGFNDIRTYTNHGKADLELSNELKLTDNGDPAESKEYSGTEAIEQLKEIAKDYYISEHNLRIQIENGVVTEVNRYFMP